MNMRQQLHQEINKNFNHNCFTDSNYFNRRISEVTEKGELAALLFYTLMVFILQYCYINYNILTKKSNDLPVIILIVN